MPKDPLIDSLISKSKEGTFGNEDYSAIYTLLESEVFDPKNYENASQKIESKLEFLDQLVHVLSLEKDQWDWDFRMFDRYKIALTLYGTGGSYDPDLGTITLFTTPNGDFMKYQNPANTIIHEITHMGMEYSLVQKYNLSHGLKERIVDTFVFLMFKKELPEYQIQQMGDIGIDKHLNKRDDIASWDAIVSKFVGK